MHQPMLLAQEDLYNYNKAKTDYNCSSTKLGENDKRCLLGENDDKCCLLGENDDKRCLITLTDISITKDITTLPTYLFAATEVTPLTPHGNAARRK